MTRDVVDDIESALCDLDAAFGELWGTRRNKPHDHTEEAWERLASAVDHLHKARNQLATSPTIVTRTPEIISLPGLDRPAS